MTAREYLGRIENIEIQIRHLTIEKLKWAELTYDIATSISSKLSDDKVQSSGDLHKMECAVINGVDKEQTFDRQIEELIAERQRIVDVITSLPALLSDILYRKYVEKQNLKEIAFELNKSYSAVAVAHLRALEKVEMLINK